MLRTLYGLYKCIWVGNDFVLHQNVIFDNFVRNPWQQLEFLEKIFRFPYLSQKIKLDPPPQGKNALVFMF